MPTGQELQHMLSKKVAQLTKVIFHLNTRNEDQETRLQNMQAAYEAEIDSIVADAAGKLSESKAALDKASSAGRLHLSATR
jgi:chromosome segregation and condensation protein ScpB